jgi:hypothetical protein
VARHAACMVCGCRTRGRNFTIAEGFKVAPSNEGVAAAEPPHMGFTTMNGKGA